MRISLDISVVFSLVRINTCVCTETGLHYKCTYIAVQLCTTHKCNPSVQVVYNRIVYIDKVQCPCECFHVYMSCVHRSKINIHKFCTVIQNICTWIYIYIKCYVRVILCHVYMSCQMRCSWNDTMKNDLWSFLSPPYSVWQASESDASVYVCLFLTPGELEN
jgi:hypothetical protein